MMKFSVTFAATIEAPNEKAARFFVAARLDGVPQPVVYHYVKVDDCRLISYGGIDAVRIP